MSFVTHRVTKDMGLKIAGFAVVLHRAAASRT
jgi:hypothetical protein